MKDLRLTIAKLLAPIKVTTYAIPLIPAPAVYEFKVVIPAPEVVEVK